MNGVKEEYSLKVKQTSKGIWYCDGLQVISETQLISTPPEGSCAHRMVPPMYT